MATLKAKTSDGKTLSINVPEGTDPSIYNRMVDDAISHYESSKAPSQPAPESTQTPLESLKSASNLIMGLSPMGSAKFLKEKVVSPLFEKAGKATEEKAQQFGFGPTASSIAGKAVEYAPDIAEIAAPAGAIFKPLTSAKTAGKAIETAEKAAGIGMTEAVKFPTTREKIQRFANVMARMSEKGPSEIQKSLEIKDIQNLRKQSEAVLEYLDKSKMPSVTSSTKALIARGKAAMTAALKAAEPSLKKPLETFEAVKKREELLRMLGKAGNLGWKAAVGGAGTAGILKLLSEDEK